MLHNTKLELSYFSLQLLEFLIQNHPHRAHEYDFIKLRGDEAAINFEHSLRCGEMQDQALADASDELYLGLHFSLYSLIRDVLWSEFSTIVPTDAVDRAAKELYHKIKHLHKPYKPDDTDVGRYREAELSDINEEELRIKIVAEIKRIFAEGYGI